MDRQEYKILSEEIMSLTAEERFVEAVEIADKINWRKVPSFSMLHKISDLYKINRRYEEALEIILLAYDRNPRSRSILYSLCELCIEVNDIGNACKYLAEYKKIAPRDTLEAYILQYEILEQQEASLEDRIELLEELNHKYYREEWAYQLAYLYHRVGLATKCVETCDQLITWFGDGPFVIKAMELKMLHAKLSSKQQEIYNRRNDIADEIEAYESDEYVEEVPEEGMESEIGEDDFHVKTIDMSKFNTLNLQAELAKSMQELLGDEYDKDSNSVTSQIIKPLMDDNDGGIMNTNADLASEDDIMSKYRDTKQFQQVNEQIEENVDETAENYTEEYVEEYEDDFELGEGEVILYEGEDGRLYYENGELYEEELFYEDGTPYQTGQIYVDEEVIEEEAGIYEEMPEEAVKSEEEIAKTRNISAMVDQEMANRTKVFTKEQEMAVKESLQQTGEIVEESIKDAISNTAKLGRVSAEEEPESIQDALRRQPENPEEYGMDFSEPKNISRDSNVAGPDSKTGEIFFEDKTGDIVIDEAPVETMSDMVAMAPEQVKGSYGRTIDIRDVETTKKPVINNPSGFEDVLSLEQDGQISLVVPEQDMLERQITGQMNLEEMLANWESIRSYQEEQIKSDRHQNILDRTGQIFEEFDEATKNDLLARLEEEHKASKRVIKNDLELKKVEDVSSVIEGPDDKVEHISIWDEVDAALEADRMLANVAEVAGDVASATVTAGGAIAGAVAGATIGEVATATVEGTVASGAAVAAATMSGEIISDLAEDASADLGDEVEEIIEESTEENLEDTEETLQEEDTESGEDAEEFDIPEVVYEEEAEQEEFSAEEDVVSEDGSLEAELEEGLEEEITEAEEVEEVDPATANLDTSEINSIGDALEAAADKVGIQTVEEINDEYSEEEAEREITQEELELFADFMYSKKMRKQILDAVDMVSLAAYVGNVIVTGDSGTGVIELAKDIIKEVQLTDSNFVAAKVAKISGAKMNKKDIASMFSQLANGALIVEHASDMNKDTLESITKVLETSQNGIIIVLTDNKKDMDTMISGYEVITGYFNVRIDITPMSNNALVSYAKKYAYGREYKIDEEKAVLALHQRISELQIGDHNVTTKEIEEIVDDAIAHSKRLSLGTYFSVLGGKRYDYEDMIILREKDFIR